MEYTCYNMNNAAIKKYEIYSNSANTYLNPLKYVSFKNIFINVNHLEMSLADFYKKCCPL